MAESKTEKQLTGKQRIFVDAYLSNGFNATQAARTASYKGDDQTLSSVGYANLRKPLIAAEVANRMNECTASANEVMATLTAHMRGSIAKVIRVAGDEALAEKLEETGADKLIKKIKIRSHFETNPDTRKAEKVFDYEFEIHDSQTAAVHVGKYHKLITERHEHSGIGGGPIVFEVEYVNENEPELPEET